MLRYLTKCLFFPCISTLRVVVAVVVVIDGCDDNGGMAMVIRVGGGAGG